MVHLSHHHMTRFGVLPLICGLALATPWLSMAQPQNAPDAVSSGPFYEAVMQFYYLDRPAHYRVPNGDAEALFALPVFLPATYAYTDEYGRKSTYEKRRKQLKSLFARHAKRGSQWQSVVKIDHIRQTDATHGTVTYTAMTTWAHPATQTGGISMRPGVSHWTYLDGQWRLVGTQVGRLYRVSSQAGS